MTAVMQLDHIVINVHREMDAAETAFTDLGFTLTPRGYHTLGSINALAMFATDYLELLGFPADGEVKRPELANAPMGLNGLVFKTSDVDETFAHLQDVGVAGDPPKSFSRPVTLDNGETHDAKFRTVAVRADAFPAGRFYFCEHLTPELVWRPEWQSHGNGAARFMELFVVTGDAAETAALIGRIIRAAAPASASDGHSVLAADNFSLRVQTPQQYEAEFGAVARPIGERSAMLGAVSVQAALPDDVLSRLRADTSRFKVASTEGGTRVSVEPYGAVIAFSA